MQLDNLFSSKYIASHDTCDDDNETDSGDNGNIKIVEADGNAAFPVPAGTAENSTTTNSQHGAWW